MKKDSKMTYDSVLGLVFTPIMHGDCMRIENNLLKVGHAKKQTSINIREDGTHYNEEYHEIDGEVEIIFDATSKYGVFWFFPN